MSRLTHDRSAKTELAMNSEQNEPCRPPVLTPALAVAAMSFAAASLAAPASAPDSLPHAAAVSTPVEHDGALDRRLRRVLHEVGFTGRVEASLIERLGRPLDPDKVSLWRFLFFDTILGLHDDNSCAGCHSPAFGFGDSQPMAMGVDHNGIVGPDRVTA